MQGQRLTHKHKRPLRGARIKLRSLYPKCAQGLGKFSPTGGKVLANFENYCDHNRAKSLTTSLVKSLVKVVTCEVQLLASRHPN
jgi:hypothetical protein